MFAKFGRYNYENPLIDEETIYVQLPENISEDYSMEEILQCFREQVDCDFSSSQWGNYSSPVFKELVNEEYFELIGVECNKWIRKGENNV